MRRGNELKDARNLVFRALENPTQPPNRRLAGYASRPAEACNTAGN